MFWLGIILLACVVAYFAKQTTNAVNARIDDLERRIGKEPRF